MIGGGGLVAATAAAARSALALLLPRVCVASERLLRAEERGLVSGLCWSRVALPPAPTCLRCGHPTGGRACSWCALWPPWVRAVRSVAWMPGGVAGRLVHALKYEGWWKVGEAMADRMARLPWPDDVCRERAAVVAVPLAAERLRARGYNQSAVLARGVAAHWRCDVWDDVLVRARATGAQARLTRAERLGNVAGAFLARAEARSRLRGRHVVLVDDVVTTAATLVACADALVAGGARIVSCVTFGRARAASDRT